jgi:hypothetical protein
VLKDGKYSVWFRTPLAEGTGVVVLASDGKLGGGDTIMLYTGHWQTDGEQFEATLFATRHSPGPGAFGEIDDLDITLTGLQGRGDRLVQGHCKASARFDVGRHARPDGGRVALGI